MDTSITKYLDQYATNFTSKWVVLIIDLILVIGAYFLALAIRFNFLYSYSQIKVYLPQLFVITIVYVITFLIFKSYVGVIRHTSLVDARRIFVSTTASKIVFIILNLFYKKLSKKNGLISTLFIIFYSLFRFVIEFTREPDTQIGLLMLSLSLGQIISVIFLIAGTILFYKNYDSKKK